MQRTVIQNRGVSLREVLPECRIHNGSDVRVTSCCSDSRRILPGDLFVALEGSQRDGHDFAREAVARGASAVLAERILPVNVPLGTVSMTRDAYGRVCQALAGNPSKQMRVIGVTGTNGKTVTNLLIASILKAAGHTVGTLNSLGYCDTEEIADAEQTTPDAPTLARWLGRMHANGCSHAVVEVSSHALAQYRTSGVEFDAAVVTNVRRDHIDYHGSVFNYRKIKGRLLRHLSPSGFGVINADDPGSKFIWSKMENPMLTVGLHSEAELMATVVERHLSEQMFLLHAGNETIPVRTRMIGDHHIKNCLQAAAIGLIYGIDLPTVVRGIESVGHVPGRLERLECGQPFGVFIDSGKSPDTLAVGLKALRHATKHRVICVFGASGDSEASQRPLLGRVLERGSDLGIITGGHTEDDTPLEYIHDILDGYDRPARGHAMPDREQAIRWALSEARSGDTVLIAGKGYESYPTLGPGMRDVTDAEVALDWLYDPANNGLHTFAEAES